MFRESGGLRAARATLALSTTALLGYLAVLAAWPQVRDRLPMGLRWFGAPNSAVTIAIVIVVMAMLVVSVVTGSGRRRTEAPVAIIAGLASATAVLGTASYWRCQDDAHPDFFTPLLWTVSLVKGGDPARSLTDGACPSPMPVALNIAQLSALAALFISLAGVALALFRSRFDRLRVRLARSLTVVVGINADGIPMLAAIARSMPRSSTLVVVTATAEGHAVDRARSLGARVVECDLDRPEVLAALPIWEKIDRLYLLAADASTNLLRLHAITARGGDERRRIPLIVRIDDPWQAAAWRAQHFGGLHDRWAADTVGVYEVTARRLLDRLLKGARIERLLLCGSSQLTTALCSDMLQRRLEHEYSGQGRLPTVSVVAPDAGSYRDDYAFAAAQLGHRDRADDIGVVDETPSVAALLQLIPEGASATTALVLVDGGLDAGAATRIAARRPQTTIHVHDPRADAAVERMAVVGRLHTYQLSLDLPGGQAHDAWERAAMLIHNRYVAESGGTGAAAAPWDELDGFYRESNRRQVRNALWMVEKIGGHTWNSWGQSSGGTGTAGLKGLDASEQLRRLGFDDDTVRAMTRAEHEDWCRYYRKHGWRYGPKRDDAAKVHDKLVDWAEIEGDPTRLDAARRSLAATLTKLQELGYRSFPASGTGWLRFRRRGTVLAEQRTAGWTWTTRDGSTMRADAGDWSVREESGGDAWSVRDDIFRATHEHLGGRRWRRMGTVLARPAVDGESVETLEGMLTAAEGSWIVQGDHGDIWAVPADEFDRRYTPAEPSRSNATGK